MPHLCFECDLYGHEKVECPKLVPKETTQPVDGAKKMQEDGGAKMCQEEKLGEEKKGYGSWMLAVKKGCRGGCKTGNGAGKNMIGNVGKEGVEVWGFGG